MAGDEPSEGDEAGAEPDAEDEASGEPAGSGGDEPPSGGGGEAEEGPDGGGDGDEGAENDGDGEEEIEDDGGDEGADEDTEGDDRDESAENDGDGDGDDEEESDGEDREVVEREGETGENDGEIGDSGDRSGTDEADDAADDPVDGAAEVGSAGDAGTDGDEGEDGGRGDEGDGNGDEEGDDDEDDANEGTDLDAVDDDPEADASDSYGGIFGGGGDGPAEDREMPLADHIREMLRRLAVVVAVAGLVSLLVFPFAEVIINFLWYSILPGVESDIARPRLYGVLELLFTQLKVASLVGLIVALPVMVYETYAFMRPGLYPHERRYYLAAIPTSLVLAVVGVSFAYFVVLPAIFLYFLEYSQDVATIGFALGRTFDLILLLMGYMAIVFQIPLFIMLAMMMGLVTRRWLAARRLLFWGAFLGVSFLFSPDPTGMAPIMVAATMIALFEGTLLLTKWTGRE